MYSDETASGSAGDRQTPLASANARSGVPSRATTTVLVSRASGSFGGKAKSRSSSDSRNATAPQRSKGRRRRQPRREYPSPSTTLSIHTPDKELSFPSTREHSAVSVRLEKQSGGKGGG